MKSKLKESKTTNFAEISIGSTFYHEGNILIKIDDWQKGQAMKNAVTLSGILFYLTEETRVIKVYPCGFETGTIIFEEVKHA